MKTVSYLISITTLSGALALMLFVTGCASSRSNSTRVVEEKQYIQLHHVQDTAQPFDLKKGDAVAMVCSKCKTVWVRKLASSSSSFPYHWGYPGAASQYYFPPRPASTWVRQHYCPGCKSTVTITGKWFDGKETVKHCGDDSIFCFATRKDASATEGMEPKIKP